MKFPAELILATSFLKLILEVIYLGTRSELTGNRKVPRWIVTLASVGFVVACGLAVRTGVAVCDKVSG